VLLGLVDRLFISILSSDGSFGRVAWEFGLVDYWMDWLLVASIRSGCSFVIQTGVLLNGMLFFRGASSLAIRIGELLD
jgi:hypothetical protein